LHIQGLVYENKIEFVWSFILTFENSRNIFNGKKEAIAQWERLSSFFVEKSEKIEKWQIRFQIFAGGRGGGN